MTLKQKIIFIRQGTASSVYFKKLCLCDIPTQNLFIIITITQIW